MDFLYGSRVPRGRAGGVRAADPRRDARRRDAVHARRRDRGAVGARRRDRRGVAARPARLPELRRGHVGAAVGRRAAAPRRAVLAAGTDARPCSRRWQGENASIVRDRAPARAHARGDGDGDAAREPAHERDDAHRVGAAAVGRGGGADARGHGGQPPVADDRARARCRTRSRALGVDLSVRCFSSGDQRRRQRGDLAAAARRPLAGAGLARAAARSSPTCRSSCAGAASRRSARRTSSSSSGSPTGSSSTRPSGTSRATASSSEVFEPRRRVGHRVGADVRLAREARRLLAGDRRAGDPRARPARRGGAAARLAGVAAPARRSARSSPRASSACASAARSCARRTSPTRTPSDLLSAELDHFGRDRVYEDAVLAAV